MKNEKTLLSSEWSAPPQVDVPEETEKKVKQWRDKKVSIEKIKNYRYSCREAEDGVIETTIFTPSGEPLFRSFTSKEQTVSQYAGGKKSQSTIDSFLPTLRIHPPYEYGNNIYTDNTSREAADDWVSIVQRRSLGADEIPIKAICKQQTDIRRSAVKRRNDKIRKSIDDAMLEIRPTPKRFDAWIDAEVMKDSRYIIYTYSGRKVQDGYCTHCEDFVKVENARNGEKGKCPVCKSRVRFIASGKAPMFKEDEDYCAYIQPDRKGLPIFRYFEIRWHYHLSNKNGRPIYTKVTYCDEIERDFYRNKSAYKWDNFRQTGEYRFCQSWDKVTRPCAIYPYNIKKVFETAARIAGHVKYMPLGALLKNIDINPYRLYDNLIKTPSVEYLTKLKLYALAQNALSGARRNTEVFNPDADSFKGVFPKGVTREDLRYFAQLNITPSELVNFYEYEKTLGKKKFTEAIWLIRGTDGRNGIDNECLDILKYTSVEKMMKYAADHIAEENKNRPSWNQRWLCYMISDWRDYVINAEKLGWNLKDSFILFPKNFEEAHDRAADLAEIENAKIMDGEVQKQEMQLNASYGYSTKSYLIRAPHSAAEIVAEGQTLRHCVATYVERVAEGKTAILFMRAAAKPDKPLYTIEVRDGELIQVRGKQNCDIKAKAEQQFFNQWKRAKLAESGRKAV